MTGFHSSTFASFLMKMDAGNVILMHKNEMRFIVEPTSDIKAIHSHRRENFSFVASSSHECPEAERKGAREQREEGVDKTGKPQKSFRIIRSLKRM